MFSISVCNVPFFFQLRHGKGVAAWMRGTKKLAGHGVHTLPGSNFRPTSFPTSPTRLFVPTERETTWERG